MLAAVVKRFGGPESIEILHTARPSLQRHQVLVRNKVAGVNPVDTYIRSGQYSVLPELPYIIGKDGSGIVEEVGDAVKHVKVGDYVWYGYESNATAQFTAVSNCFLLPEGVELAEGACLGVPYLTAYRAMFIQGCVKPSDVILVHGASGGVGSAIVQLAAWKGIRTVGTAGSIVGLDYLRNLGLHQVYDHSKPGYIEEISAEFPNGFDYIFEMAAHINLNNDMGLLAKHGKLAVIGNRAETKINARQLMQKESIVYGVMLGMSNCEDILTSGSEINKFLTETKFRPNISKTYTMNTIAQAHCDILNNSGSHGQIVINIE
ncbi:unnamed protein product [Caenorhabditis bovis]|uniref:15-oxoprostaglandin 13-reductase n=1 Tax=Caenorhabditis bovis TaxID=2654633 RepID=A0A8S1FF50_9PELO|nr:unnamed protein product [Caenorhabditis bovis]